jgi:ElaB/YqjD/DUF883 family membrane-anchored ribosome-binding protein
MQRTRAANVDHLLNDLERRLSRLSDMLPSRASSSAKMDSISDAAASALNEIADKFRNRSRAVAADAGRYGEDALELGNDALRKLSREVEQRPLMALAIAIGVGALAFGLLSRR